MLAIWNRHRRTGSANARPPKLTAADLKAHIDALAVETDQTLQTLSVWARQLGQEQALRAPLRYAR